MVNESWKEHPRMKSRLQTHGGTLHWLSTIAVIAADLSLWQNIPLFSKAYQRGYRVNTKQNGSFPPPRLYAKPLLITAITAIVLPLTLSTFDMSLLKFKDHVR